MNSLLTSLLGAGRQRGADPAVPEQEQPNEEMGLAPEFSASALAELGHETEAIRRQHRDLLGGVQALARLEAPLQAVFERSEALFGEFANARAELAQSEGLREVENEALVAATRRIADLSGVNEKMRSEIDAARAEAARLSQSLATTQKDAIDAEAQKNALLDEFNQTQAEFAALKEQARHTEADLEALRDVLKEADARGALSTHELAKTQEKLAIAEQTGAALAKRLEEARADGARILAELANERDEHATLRNKAASLETTLQMQVADHGRMRALFQAEADKLNEEIGALRTQTVRAEAVEAVRERLLQEAQTDRMATAEQLTAAERRINELTHALQQSEESLSMMEKARERAEGRVNAAQATQKRMLRRVTPLIASLREKTQDVRAKASLIAELEIRIEERTRELNALTQMSDQRAAALTAELETERARRTLAEGALGDDRERRATALGKSAREDEANWARVQAAVAAPTPLLGRTRSTRGSAKLKRPNDPHAA